MGSWAKEHNPASRVVARSVAADTEERVAALRVLVAGVRHGDAAFDLLQSLHLRILSGALVCVLLLPVQWRSAGLR